MLLIFLWGLFAKLALVSGDCDVGNMTLKDFDWSKFSGNRTWYSLSRKPNGLKNDLDCHMGLISSPEGNRSSITSDVYVISEQRHVKMDGYATNWNRTGYFEMHLSPPMENTEVYILEVEYNHFFIGKFCPFDSKKPFALLGFRSKNPDKALVKDVLTKLQDNNIDSSQFLESRAVHCQ